MIHLSADGKFVAIGSQIRERHHQGRRAVHRQPVVDHKADAELDRAGRHVAQRRTRGHLGPTLQPRRQRQPGTGMAIPAPSSCGSAKEGKEKAKLVSDI